MSQQKAPVILMAAENPSGHKLEDLAGQLSEDMAWKDQKLDALLQAETVPTKVHALRRAKENNRWIMEALRMIRARQLDTMQAFLMFGPDQGPTGTPRIGAGNEGGDRGGL